MKLSTIVDLLRVKAQEITGLNVSVGFPGPGEGIAFNLISGSLQDTYMVSSEHRSIGFTFYVKHKSQQKAMDLAQEIGDGLTRWKYPSGINWQITKISHGGAFYITQEESTKLWIYGVSVDLNLYY